MEHQLPPRLYAMDALQPHIVRPKCVEACWNLVNRDFVSKNCSR
jgi:hypothetical protein